MRGGRLQAIDSIEALQADALRIECEALQEAEQQTSVLGALEEQRQRHVVLAEERSHQQEIQAQLHQNQLEVKRLQLLKTSLEEEVYETFRRVAVDEKQEQSLQEIVAASTQTCEDLERKLRHFEETVLTRHGGLRQLEAEVKVAQENVAVELEEAEPDEHMQALVAMRSEELRQREASLRHRCRQEEAATSQLWEERVHRSETEAKEVALQIQQKHVEILQSIQREAEKESLQSRHRGSALRAELQESQAQVQLEASEPKGQPAELRQKRQEELYLSAQVQELREEVKNLQMRSQQQADDIKAMQLEEQSGSEEVQSLQEELTHFRAEAASNFGLPLHLQFSSLKDALSTGEEAMARLRLSNKLSESVLAALDASQESKGRGSDEVELKAEVKNLRLERERLVELGNDLRAEVRDVEGSELGAPQRKQLLEAALRGLVAENRRLQGELLEAGRIPTAPPMTSSVVDSELPSSSSLRPSRGSRLADRREREREQGADIEGRETLMLQGIAAPSGASSTLPRSAPGYLRQPLSDAVPPRSATDRGTESQRKALERLRAAQVKHDEVAAAAAEQRQKVLPLIRWRDTATAAATER